MRGLLEIHDRRTRAEADEAAAGAELWGETKRLVGGVIKESEKYPVPSPGGFIRTLSDPSDPYYTPDWWDARNLIALVHMYPSGSQMLGAQVDYQAYKDREHMGDVLAMGQALSRNYLRPLDLIVEAGRGESNAPEDFHRPLSGLERLGKFADAAATLLPLLSAAKIGGPGSGMFLRLVTAEGQELRLAVVAADGLSVDARVAGAMAGEGRLISMMGKPTGQGGDGSPDPNSGQNSYSGKQANEVLMSEGLSPMRGGSSSQLARAVDAGYEEPVKALLRDYGLAGNDVDRLTARLFQDAKVLPRPGIPTAPARLPLSGLEPADLIPPKEAPVGAKYLVDGQEPIRLDLRRADWQQTYPENTPPGGVYIVRNAETGQILKPGDASSYTRLSEYRRWVTNDGIPIVVDYYPMEPTVGRPLHRVANDLRSKLGTDGWNLPRDWENIGPNTRPSATVTREE
jgi:hypothetical protein